MTTLNFSRVLSAVAGLPAVRSTVRDSSVIQPLVRRFVAGETVEDAMRVARELSEAGIAVALDNLGENTVSQTEAGHATDEALDAVDRLNAASLDGYISVKLTQLGLDVGEHVAVANAERLLTHAEQSGRFVRLDMEGSSYTARTVEIFEQLRATHANVGIVMQAYLYRSKADIEHLTDLGASIRLCKGAYNEPPHIAYRRKRDTDRNYVRLMEYLLHNGVMPALATHDESMINHALEFVSEQNIDRQCFEFQMLYGIRRDLQSMLVARGFRMRVYLPYGSQWYPYLTRRLAERPANILSMSKSIGREYSHRPDESALSQS